MPEITPYLNHNFRARALFLLLALGMPTLGPLLLEGILYVQFVHLSICPSVHLSLGMGSREEMDIRCRRSYRGD